MYVSMVLRQSVWCIVNAVYNVGVAIAVCKFEWNRFSVFACFFMAFASWRESILNLLAKIKSKIFLL